MKSKQNEGQWLRLPGAEPLRRGDAAALGGLAPGGRLHPGPLGAGAARRAGSVGKVVLPLNP